MDIFGKGEGYRWMDAYILAWVVELATNAFCDKFLDFRNDPQDKTAGQMNHAARSGCRNFAEGCERLMTSTAGGLDLLNIAKGSLCELRDDYIKWLLCRDTLPWDDDDEQARAVSRLDLEPPPGAVAVKGARRTPPFTTRRFCEHLMKQRKRFSLWLDSPDPDVRANALLILCIRAAKMQQAYIERVGEDFKTEGGFKEKMGAARREQRSQAEPAAADAPSCPSCGESMRIMYRKRDNVPFWSCRNYPACRGALPVQSAPPPSPPSK